MARWTEAETDVRMGRLLQWGVVLAAVVMGCGAAVFLYHNAERVPNYRTFRDVSSPLHSLRGILGEARLGHGAGLIQLAVLLIVATPISRVIFAAYAFARMRDWLYALISMTVLSLLLFAIVHSA